MLQEDDYAAGKKNTTENATFTFTAKTTLRLLCQRDKITNSSCHFTTQPTLPRKSFQFKNNNFKLKLKKSREAQNEKDGKTIVKQMENINIITYLTYSFICSSSWVPPAAAVFNCTLLRSLRITTSDKKQLQRIKILKIEFICYKIASLS